MRISIGKSRKDIHWKVVDKSWEELCNDLSRNYITSETVAEYKKMSKDDKSSKKDVGGFVGGVVSGGRRTRANVTSRSLVTLDADYADKNIWDRVSMLFDYAICCYSTHSHTPELPRLRFVIPLDREVTPEEYEPIARRIAYDIGIEQFDVTTYETSRLMYWPSTPKDGEFIFEKLDGDFLSADSVLKTYTDWHDMTEWPIASFENSVRVKQAKAQGNPEDKPGMVGLFCRAYDIHSAIDTFLPSVYIQCDEPSRYTYADGSTSAGVVVYDNGKFAYSHHATDPAGSVLCNAFDLVRLHKFGDLDADCDRDTPVTKLPSYKAMCEFAREDDIVKQTSIEETITEAKEAFAKEVVGDETYNWTSKLSLNKAGEVDATTENILLILENDPNLKGCFAQNKFLNRLCIIMNTPWRKCEDKLNGSTWTDIDDSALRHYIETTYHVSNQAKVTDALNVAMLNHAFHPIKNYLDGLEWDGIERGETLFIYYMGAEDNRYTRTVTRKWLTAAVARIMQPGIKFDNMVVLVGAQGIGKSYLGNMLGKGWFSDTFNTLSGKEAYEQLKGAWIIEMGELSVMKKAEVESVKQFISKREDNYRAAYGRHTQVNKRQCVFYGTTNDDSFLRDRTGNRRFWPIGCHVTDCLYEVFDLTEEDIDQIWAEAVHWYKRGEKLFLDQEVMEMAVEEQNKYMVLNPEIGIVEDYLDKPIPANWYELDKTQRRNYIQGYIDFPDTEMMQRNTINVAELAYELYGIEPVKTYEAKEYHNILIGLTGWKKTGKRVRSIYGQQMAYERI